jgi:hypothetical protein
MRTKIEGGFRRTEAEAFFGGESDLNAFAITREAKLLPDIDDYGRGWSLVSWMSDLAFLADGHQTWRHLRKVSIANRSPNSLREKSKH